MSPGADVQKSDRPGAEQIGEADPPGSTPQLASRVLRFPSPIQHTLPIVRPDPPRLSSRVEELVVLENSGISSNYGPINSRFEAELIATCFGLGSCLTVCNATMGLMLAIGDVVGEEGLFRREPEKRLALMPSFTFAATAHAALWCGLTPLFCDIDPNTWLPDAEHEEALLERYAGEIAVVIPCATFGNNLELSRYERLSQKHGIPIVVDAAASLGCLDVSGQGFGTGFPWPVVFSMHATKPFSVGEGGVIYCADGERISRLRAMGSFGFEQPRTASLPGLNTKISELTALAAVQQLRQFPDSVTHRVELTAAYQKMWPDCLPRQVQCGKRQVRSFESVLLPQDLAPQRHAIMQRLSHKGVGSATYFSPHLAEQPLFQRFAIADKLPVTQDLASRILSLPLHPTMSERDVARVAAVLIEVLDGFAEARE